MYINSWDLPFHLYLFYFNFPFKNALCSDELMPCIPWTKSFGPWTAGPGDNQLDLMRCIPWTSSSWTRYIPVGLY